MGDKIIKRDGQWAIEREADYGSDYTAIDENEAARLMMDLGMEKPDLIEDSDFPVEGMNGMGFEQFRRGVLKQMAQGKLKPKAKAAPVETEESRRKAQLGNKKGPVAADFEALSLMLKGKV